MKNNFRLEPFPLKHAARKSMNKRLREIKHISKSGKYNKHIEKDTWFVESQARYETVKLALYKGRWWLAYENERCTGGFKTRIEAINWFIKGGR